MKISIFRLIPIIALLIVQCSCGAIIEKGFSYYDRLFGPEKEQGPEELLDDGMSALNKKDYEKAADLFQMLKDRYPYSRYAIVAELKMADALFLKGEYDSAYDAYDEFERLHPKNRDIPYVIYQKGMCHFRQIKSSDRDQTHTLLSKKEFERLIKRFPTNRYSRLSQMHLRRCIISLCKHELYVGRFYMKQKRYRAALRRFLKVIKEYPDMGFHQQALRYIVECKRKIRESS